MSSKYVKILPRSLMIRGVKYEEGVIIDIQDRNDDPDVKIGLHFCEFQLFPKYLDKGDLIADVKVLKAYPKVKTNYCYGYKAYKIKISNIREISDLDCWNDFDFCENAVNMNGHALKYIKEQNFTLAYIAITNNPYALEHVDEKTISAELCVHAVSKEGLTLAFVPDNLKDKFIISTAVENNKFAAQYIENKFHGVCELLEAI